MSEDVNIRDIRRSKSSNQRIVRLILLLVGLVFLAGSLYSLSIYVLSYLAGLDTVAAVSHEQTVSGFAWSFQREYVTYTDRECILIPIVNEGTRVSKGLEVARLNFLGETRLNEPSNRRLYSPVAGIVSYEPDGLEIINDLRDYQLLTIVELDKLIGPTETAQKATSGLAGLIQEKVLSESRGTGGITADAGSETEQKPAASQTSSPREIQSDNVAMKITDNLSDCYVYMRITSQKERPFIPGDRFTVKLESAGEGRGIVLQCEEISVGWGLLFKLENGLETLRHSRRHRLDIMLGVEESCVVPLGAVVMKDGEIGVYVAERNRAKWKPVMIIEDRDGVQVIEGAQPGDIGPGDLIVTRPWLIWEGMRLQGGLS